MRICPINTVNYCTKVTNQKHRTTTAPREVQFKSWQGSAGAIIGTAAGIGLGFLTGGLGAILIGSMVGCAAGGAVGESQGNHNDDDISYDDIPYIHD